MSPADAPLMPFDSNRPIVVQAVPRSGSHLLRHVLNAHPDVLIAAASEVMSVLGNPELTLHDLERRLAAEAGETLRSADHLLSALRAFHLAFWTTSGERRRLGKETARRWGFCDYTRPGAERLPLATLFPGAQVVHIVRDGRNVVASWLANWRIASSRMGVSLRQPAEVARLWVERLAAVDPATTRVIRVEDLHDAAARPGTIAAILAHCELAPCAETTALHGELPWVNAQRQVLSRWQDELAPAVVASLMKVRGFAATLARFGYE